MTAIGLSTLARCTVVDVEKENTSSFATIPIIAVEGRRKDIWF